MARDLLSQASTKRRRIDEDFSLYVCHKAVIDYRARTVGSCVKASGLVAETTACTWVGPHIVPVQVRDDSELPAQSVHQRYV